MAQSPLSMLFGAVFAACAGNLAYAQDSIGNAISNAPTPENEQLAPNLQPSIASSIPALGEFKKGLRDLGYNFQLNYTGEVLGNPTGGVRQRATTRTFSNLCSMVILTRSLG